MKIYGGIEAGGTKFVCMLGNNPDQVLAQTRFPTTDPDETIGKAVEFFKNNIGNNSLEAVGIGSFGPVDLDPDSEKYGHITTTPKPGWEDADISGRIQAALDLPVAFDTDVNAAAYGEHLWGAAKGIDPMVYITIGTGIGAGGIFNGKPMHGLVHPETGHMRLPHDWEDDPFPGICPYHGDCFEGLASGPAIKERWEKSGEKLPVDHPAWDLEATYIALALSNLICVLSPRRVVIGGGVMHQENLLPLVQQKVQDTLNGYIKSPEILNHIDRYVVLPGLGDRAGVLGAIALAEKLKV